MPSIWCEASLTHWPSEATLGSQAATQRPLGARCALGKRVSCARVYGGGHGDICPSQAQPWPAHCPATHLPKCVILYPLACSPLTLCCLFTVFPFHDPGMPGRYLLSSLLLCFFPVCQATDTFHFLLFLPPSLSHPFYLQFTLSADFMGTCACLRILYLRTQMTSAFSSSIHPL